MKISKMFLSMTAVLLMTGIPAFASDDGIKIIKDGNNYNSEILIRAECTKNVWWRLSDKSVEKCASEKGKNAAERLCTAKGGVLFDVHKAEGSHGRYLGGGQMQSYMQYVIFTSGTCYR